MASLLGEDLGATVGYRIRGEKRVSAATRVEVVTEGILTRRLQSDPSLAGVGLVIFDEVHERNLHTDLALALVLDVRRSLRPDLALAAMSATIDAARLAKVMSADGEEVRSIEAEGRTFPIDVRWRPRHRDQRVAGAVAAVVREALASDDGDVLVFLAGAGDIRRVHSELSGLPDGVDVRPLFGALTSAEQDAALAASPPGRRRVVLSTDIAETSLTVAGVRIVVDAGESRRPCYDARSGLTRLETRSASRASAEQRSGRAGRTEPGAAYRMWDQHAHARREAFAEPEILAVDLSALALEVAVWGATPDQLSFLDPPPEPRYRDATNLLVGLAAIDGAGRPTPTGRAMSELPLHPRLAHMVVVSRATPDAWLACVIAALLEERDVFRGRPEDVPADLADRVRCVVDRQNDESKSGRIAGYAVASARRNARDLARRLGVSVGEVDTRRCGVVAALAYPDRVAQARGGGRFRLRSGRGVSLGPNDALSAEEFLVVAELGGGTGADDRVRIAAGLDRADLERIVGADVATISQIEWDADRNDVVRREQRCVDAIVLSSVSSAPSPSDEVTAALVGQVASTALSMLTWTKKARSLQGQAAFAREHLGDAWPDLSDAALLGTLDEWLTPRLVAATGRNDVEKIDMVGVMRQILGHERMAQLDSTVPATVAIPSGRRVHVDYDSDPPSISVRAQEMFGSTSHPTVAGGRVPLAVHLLSPAGRPIQVTADLPGFWSGSWDAVRKEMVGRYPKHNWPADPTTARPSTRAERDR